MSLLPAGGSPSLICQLCGVVFNTARNRVRHERRVHLRHAGHPCPICRRTFTRQDNMRVHMKKMHGMVPEASGSGAAGVRP